MPTIGYLSAGSELEARPQRDAFRSGLVDLGYTEGKNIRVLYRYAEGKAERLSVLASEMVSLGTMAILAGGTTAIRAAHEAAPNVPIVARGGPNPVWAGWAQTLARPGGMITGVFLAGTMSKRFELLKAVRPQATTFGYLLNANNPINPLFRKDADDVARRLGMNLEIIEVKEPSEHELADAFDRMGSRGVAGVLIIPDAFFFISAPTIANVARIHKLPSVGEGPDFVDAGGLFAFSEDYLAIGRRCAWYVDQILKGTAPGDLPAEQTMVFKLIVNLKTAKELGITIPPSVLARADEVIE